MFKLCVIAIIIVWILYSVSATNHVCDIQKHEEHLDFMILFNENIQKFSYCIDQIVENINNNISYDNTCYTKELNGFLVFASIYIANMDV
jgi:hypothetical protein